MPARQMRRRRGDANRRRQFGVWLRECRIQAGLTQGEAAEAIGGTCTRSTVYRWETGRHAPPINVMVALKRLYGFEWSEVEEMAQFLPMRDDAGKKRGSA